MTAPDKNSFMPFKEFVALMALLVSITALAIDTVIPALPMMGTDLQVVGVNDTQYVISVLFMGFTLGQIIYGPISDSFGRKRAIYIGLGLFIIGCVLSYTARSFEMMLIGRLLQGFGAASSRVISIAMVRDKYGGRDMARVMSFVMAVFILVPALAPGLGQIILLFAHWRAIFLVFLTIAILSMIWMFFRLPETLHANERKAFTISVIAHGLREVVTNKITFGYTLCAGLIFGALIGYLTSAQQIFQAYYGLGDIFSVYFAVLALAIGVASIFNSSIVKRFGMRIISHHALQVMMATALVFGVVAYMMPYTVPLWGFMAFAIVTFFALGLLFGNLNALAMEPMGHIAGLASAAVGALSSLLSVTVGTLIGQAYNDTLFPLAVGFFAVSFLAYILQLTLDDKSPHP